MGSSFSSGSTVSISELLLEESSVSSMFILPTELEIGALSPFPADVHPYMADALGESVKNELVRGLRGGIIMPF